MMVSAPLPATVADFQRTEGEPLLHLDKDAKYWDFFLSDRFVGWGSSRLDKASATKEYTGADCDIKSYALSDQEISPLGENVALLDDSTICRMRNKHNSNAN